MKLIPWSCLLITLASFTSVSCKNKDPGNIWTFLEQADQFEFLSLQPESEGSERPEPENDFHRHTVLGKIRVQDPETRKELIAALKKGTEENTSGAVKCFWPRHGIRATHEGKTIDLAVCFHCLQVYVYVNEDPVRKEVILTSKSPEPLFDKVLQDAGIPLGKIPGK
jgi:hypothetical protein